MKCPATDGGLVPPFDSDLMQAVMERSAQRGFAGIRLVQAGYHSRSLALYLKLGFEVREPLTCLQAGDRQGPARLCGAPGDDRRYCGLQSAVPGRAWA